MDPLIILEKIVSFLWGWPLTLSLVGMGLYLTIRGKFWQFRHLKDCLAYMRKSKGGDDYKKTGKISGIKALSIACGAAIGVGNIGGVASAIALGGPGVLFWMWVTALVGMMTKCVEVTLGVHYRSVDQNGKTFGGPTYYIEKGFKELGLKGGRILATLFALSLFLELFFGMENYTVSEAISSTFHVPQIAAAVVYWAVGKSIVLGGMKVISKAASVIVPTMSVFYVAGGLFILVRTFPNLPNTFALIFQGAFTPMAAVGGFAGSAFIITMRTGIARGLYSNEAGWGTSPMAHSSADVQHPVEQGMMGVLEVFFDTFVVCTITGLVIINTGAWTSGASGATLSLMAFNMGFGGEIGGIVMTISLVLFCLTTHFGWFVFFETVLRYLFRNHNKWKERFVILLKVFVHGTASLILTIAVVGMGWDSSNVWLFADLATSIPTYINIFAVLILSGKFFQLLKHYNKKAFNEKNDSPDEIELFSSTMMPYEEKDAQERASAAQ